MSRDDDLRDLADDDVRALRELAGGLPIDDVADADASRIAREARMHQTAAPPLARVLEPIAVALCATSVMGWALIKVLEVFS